MTDDMTARLRYVYRTLPTWLSRLDPLYRTVCMYRYRSLIQYHEWEYGTKSWEGSETELNTDY